MQKNIITVDLAYKTQKIKLNVPEGISLGDAVKNQALYQRYLSEVKTPQFGIFGKVVSGDYILKEGMRIELYLPLLCDPMLKRKNKVNPNRYRRKS